MDSDDFDPMSPTSVSYVPDGERSDFPKRRRARRLVDDVGYVPTTRPSQSTGGLPYRQIALIIGANAILSLIISLIVVAIAGPKAPSQPEVVTTETRAMAAESSQVPATETVGEVLSPGPGPPAFETDTIAATDEPSPAESVPAQPPAAPTTYIVQPGDTLGTIAQQFDVSMEDLMRANGIDNADYLLLGQELVIPIGGMPILTATPMPAPGPADTPLSFEPPTPLPDGATPPVVPASSVIPTPTAVPTLTPAPVSDVQLSLEVLHPGNPEKDEMVYVVNNGLYVRLVGWTLSNGRGDTYTFPEFGLGGGGAAIAVHTGSGADTITDLYWGRPATAWVVGDVATLMDESGAVVATYAVMAPAP